MSVLWVKMGLFGEVNSVWFGSNWVRKKHVSESGPKTFERACGQISWWVYILSEVNNGWFSSLKVLFWIILRHVREVKKRGEYTFWVPFFLRKVDKSYPKWPPKLVVFPRESLISPPNSFDIPSQVDPNTSEMPKTSVLWGNVPKTPSKSRCSPINKGSSSINP